MRVAPLAGKNLRHYANGDYTLLAFVLSKRFIDYERAIGSLKSEETN